MVGAACALFAFAFLGHDGKALGMSILRVATVPLMLRLFRDVCRQSQCQQPGLPANKRREDCEASVWTENIRSRKPLIEPLTFPASLLPWTGRPQAAPGHGMPPQPWGCSPQGHISVVCAFGTFGISPPPPPKICIIMYSYVYTYSAFSYPQAALIWDTAFVHGSVITGGLCDRHPRGLTT